MKICANPDCGREIVGRRSNAIYCSKGCQWGTPPEPPIKTCAYAECDNEFPAKPKSRKYCSMGCQNANKVWADRERRRTDPEFRAVRQARIRAYQKKKYAEDPEWKARALRKVRERASAPGLEHPVHKGITNAEYAELEKLNCDVCKDPLFKDSRDFAIDHDHRCQMHGKSSTCPACRRGVLCRRCNWIEGHANGRLDLLGSAFHEYLANGTLNFVAHHGRLPEPAYDWELRLVASVSVLEAARA